jgi:PKD repeat protein
VHAKNGEEAIVAFQNEVIIDNTSKYATDFEWDFGNGMLSFDKNPQNVTYNAPGTYTVSLTASNYCCSNTYTTEIEIADLSLGVQTSVIKNASCNGFANGEIDINIAGGTGKYDIEITPSISSYSQIPAGEYSISISDGETEITDSFVITEPDVLTAEESAEDSDINMNNGSATISIEGGTEPYTILWSTDETTATIENLEPGIYYFDVDDANGCTISGSVEVSTIYATMESSVTIVNNVSCFNGEDGVATLSVIGGNAPYEITISPEITDLNSLKAGEYDVTIVDQDDQTITNNFVITQPDALLLVDEVQESIEGEDNGMITIELSGGTEPYTILWSNGEETETITNLSPATYTVEVTDANDCIITGSFEVGSIVSIFNEEIADFGLNPNPTTGFMIVTEMPKDINRAVVIDMIGREVNLDVQKILEQDQVNVSHLAKGVYILKLVDDQGTIYSSKFIKE